MCGVNGINGLRGARTGRSANTIAAYRSDLCQFADFVVALGQGTLVAVIGQHHVARWLDELSARGITLRSQARKLSTLRMFCRHAKADGWIGHDPTADEQLKFRTARVIAPELDQLHAMIDAIPRTGWVNLRDRAMLRIALDTGARVSEVGGLDIPGSAAQSAVDLGRRIVHVIAKGGDVDTLPINDATARIVEEWLAARAPVAAPGHTALFVNARGVRCARGTLHGICRMRGAAVGLQGLHMHLLRHRRGAMVVETCGDKIGQQFLRHASLATTSQYGRHANNRTLALLRTAADIDQGRAQACNP